MSMAPLDFLHLQHVKTPCPSAAPLSNNPGDACALVAAFEASTSDLA